MTPDLTPFLVTARIALLSTLLVVVIGLPLSRAFSLLSRRGLATRRLVAALDTLALVPLVLPPTTLGYFLLVLLGRRGPFGALLEPLGVRLVFNVPGAVLAAAVASFPLFFEPARKAFDAVPPAIENAARLLGATEGEVFRRVTLPLACRGLASGAVLAFARAVGDFGTTLMVAGSIPGRTETVAIAIYDAVQMGDDERALFLALAITLFSLSAIAATRLVSASHARRPL